MLRTTADTGEVMTARGLLPRRNAPGDAVPPWVRWRPVWRRDGDHFTLVSPVRYDLMASKAERQWFYKHAQELVDTQAAPYGPDLVATLPDDTTYSVHGDHGGIQRAAQENPIVFAGAGLSSKDVKAPVRSVDILPTILKAMGITPDPAFPMDGVGYPLPLAK